MDAVLRNRTMGRLAAGLVFLILIAGIVSFRYAREHWWLPALASQEAGRIDAMFLTMLATIGGVFIIVHVLLAFVVFRFVMDPARKGAYIHENARLEYTWTILTAAILVAFVVMGGSIWAAFQIQPAGLGPAAHQAGDVLQVEVVGRQFFWNMRYPGPDGELAQAAPRFMTADNPLGIDPDDPAGADDVVVVNELVLPAGRRVRLQLRSADVIHSFFLPHFRIKMDAVPGRTTEIWLDPSETGEYEAVCAELCGAGHYVMRSRVVVVDPDDFEEWLANQANAGDAGAR